MSCLPSPALITAAVDFWERRLTGAGIPGWRHHQHIGEMHGIKVMRCRSRLALLMELAGPLQCIKVAPKPLPASSRRCGCGSNSRRRVDQRPAGEAIALLSALRVEGEIGSERSRGLRLLPRGPWMPSRCGLAVSRSAGGSAHRRRSYSGLLRGREPQWRNIEDFSVIAAALGLVRYPVSLLSGRFFLR